MHMLHSYFFSATLPPTYRGPVEDIDDRQTFWYVDTLIQGQKSMSISQLQSRILTESAKVNE